jgi:membrane protein
MDLDRFFHFFLHINARTIHRTVKGVLRQRLPSLAAEMAYNATLALFPAILTILVAISLFQPLTNTFLRVVGHLSQVVPQEAMILIENFTREILAGGDRGLFSVSFVVAVWASSGAMSAAMRAMDQIHRIPMEEMRPFWKAKLISLGLTLGTIFLLITATALVFVSDLVARNVARQYDTLGLMLLKSLGYLAIPLALAIMAIAFSFVYRYGPSRWSPGKPILPGAILSAVSWAVISSWFRHYVSHFGNYNRVYGTVGTFIVLLLWLYLSSLIMLVGDQLNVSVGEAMQQSKTQPNPEAQVPSSEPPRQSVRPDRIGLMNERKRWRSPKFFRVKQLGKD